MNGFDAKNLLDEIDKLLWRTKENPYNSLELKMVSNYLSYYRNFISKQLENCDIKFY